MSRFRSLPQSFKYAWDGVKEAFANEPNFRIHFIIAVFALSLAYILHFSTFEWLLLFFTIAFVLILELLNTALEKIVDLVSPKIRPKAKIAKDVSAAAVLFAAALSIIVGVSLFLQKIIAATPNITQ